MKTIKHSLIYFNVFDLIKLFCSIVFNKRTNVHFYRLLSVFAWEAYEQGSDVHLQADPTKLELLHKTYNIKKEGYKEDQKEGILAKVSLILNIVFPTPSILFTTFIYTLFFSHLYESKTV